MSKKFVFDLGGSIIAPKEMNVEFLKNLRTFFQEQTAEGKKFFLIIGGGAAARKYQGAVKEVRDLSQEDLDSLGIAATRLNAFFTKTFLGEELAHQDIFLSPEELPETDKPIVVCGGHKPGASTDYVSVKVAKNTGADTVLVLSNIDYVYTKDPNKFTDAEKIEKISWVDFKSKIIGNEWIPGANLPFDPMACKLAQELGLKVVFMNGNNLENLKKFMNGEEFVGTVIE